MPTEPDVPIDAHPIGRRMRAGRLFNEQQPAVSPMPARSTTTAQPYSVDSLLQTLNAEIVKRLGDRVAPLLRVKLTPKERGLAKSVLSVYTGAQLLALVRLLVWDWEPVREELFPPCPQQQFPTMLDLGRWHNTLSTMIGRGYVSRNPIFRGRRGYADRYLSEVDPTITQAPDVLSMGDDELRSRGYIP